MRSIQVFDDIQRKDAIEQAKTMRGSDKPLQECIQFGRLWAKPEVGLARGRIAYEQAKKRRELETEGQSVEAKRARLLRELEELEESA